jgi:hypothetical protein
MKTHCIRGHERTPENVTSRRQCKLCRTLRNREFRLLNKEYNKNYRLENRETILANHKIYYQNNKSKAKLASFKSRQKNLERRKEGEKKYKQKARKEMANWYVCKSTRIERNSPHEVIELARSLMILRKEITKCKTLRLSTTCG